MTERVGAVTRTSSRQFAQRQLELARRFDKLQTRMEELLTKSGQKSVPVTDIDGTIVRGLDRPKIDAALRDKGLIS